jgi:hypothetical protein
MGTEDTRGTANRYKIQVIVDKYNYGKGVADESDNFFNIIPSTEATSNWKTYINNSERYSLTYPVNWHLYDSYKPELVTITNLELLDGRDGLPAPEDIIIRVYTYNNLLKDETVESWVNRTGLSDKRSILVDGVKAIKGRTIYTGEEESGYYKKGESSGEDVRVVYNGKGYQISYSPYGSKFASTFDQILSTFKFTKFPTSDWKTYINTNYGIEFKYPSTYTVKDNSYVTPGGGAFPSLLIVLPNEQKDERYVTVGSRTLVSTAPEISCNGTFTRCREFGGNIVFTRSGDSPILDLFDSVISTVKFTK